MHNSTHYTDGEQVRVWDADSQRYYYGTIDRHVESFGDRTMPEGKVHVRVKQPDFLTGGWRWLTKLVETSRIERDVQF